MNKKKVMFLLAAFDKGGIEKVTLDIVNNLDQKKYDITIYTIWWGGVCQSLVKNHIKVKPFFFKRYVRGIVRLINVLPPKMLYRFFIRGKYDVEIAAGDGECSKIISGSPNKKSKKIAWIHMDVIERGSGLKEFSDRESARKIYEVFNSIVCVSEACRRQFIRKFGFADKSIVKRNPIPTKEILKKANEKCSDMKLSDAGCNLIAVGRLVEQKGFDRLLYCCDKLQNRDNIGFKLNIVGEGPKRNELEAYIKEHNLSDSVHFLGFKDNPYKYIKNSDMFILSSRDEAFPLVVGEALTLGKTVIATECAGIKEWLGDNEYGIICENNTDALYQTIKKVLENKEMAENYKKKAKKRAEQISFEKSLKDFEMIL